MKILPAILYIQGAEKKKERGPRRRPTARPVRKDRSSREHSSRGYLLCGSQPGCRFGAGRDPSGAHCTKRRRQPFQPDGHRRRHHQPEGQGGPAHPHLRGRPGLRPAEGLHRPAGTGAHPGQTPASGEDGTPGQAVHAPGAPGTPHPLWPARYIAGSPAAPGDPGAAFPLSSRFAAGCRIFPPAPHKGG